MLKVIINIEDLMKSRGISTFEELSKITGVRRAALSELVRGKRQRIEFEHIEKIATALNVSDIREIIDICYNAE